MSSPSRSDVSTASLRRATADSEIAAATSNGAAAKNPVVTMEPAPTWLPRTTSATVRATSLKRPHRRSPSHERPAEPGGARGFPSCVCGRNAGRKGCEEPGRRRLRPSSPYPQEPGWLSPSANTPVNAARSTNGPRLVRPGEEATSEILTAALQRRLSGRHRVHGSRWRGLTTGHHVYYHTLDLVTVKL